MTGESPDEAGHSGAPILYILRLWRELLVNVFRGLPRNEGSASSITFFANFYMLAGFGLVHGITELIDWLRFILETSGAGEFKVLLIFSQSCLITSFVLLLQFGVTLLTYRSEKEGIYRTLPALLFVAYIGYLFITGTSHMRTAGLIARRSFGFSGALLSGLAFFRLAKSMKAVGHPRLTNGLVVTGIAL